MSDIIRVLRLIEYEGPRELVQEQVEKSIHGTRRVMEGKRPGVRITVTTLGMFPEIIEEARQTPDPSYVRDLKIDIEDLQDEVRRLREREGERG